MRWRGLAIYAAFDLVWFACAAGAARGSNTVGVVAALTFVLATLWVRNWPRAEVMLILMAGICGAVAETIFVHAGLVRFGASLPESDLAPPWIVALWLAFGATLSTTAEMLGARAGAKAAVLGLVVGPMAYAGGEALGALAINGPPWRAYAVIGAAWAIAFPALVMLHAADLLGRFRS